MIRGDIPHRSSRAINCFFSLPPVPPPPLPPPHSFSSSSQLLFSSYSQYLDLRANDSGESDDERDDIPHTDHPEQLLAEQPAMRNAGNTGVKGVLAEYLFPLLSPFF